MRKALGTVLLGGAAAAAPFFLWAQENSCEFPQAIGAFRGGSDSVAIFAVSEHEAILTYQNHFTMGSMMGTETVCVNGIIVDVYVEFGQDSREKATPRPRNRNYVSIPESHEVEDGEGFEFKIVPAMF